LRRLLEQKGMIDNNILENHLTKAATAAQLGVTERTLDRWDRLRSGPPRTKMGQAVLYRVDALRTWLKAQEREQPRGRLK
jgi:hypothetical protein